MPALQPIRLESVVEHRTGQKCPRCCVTLSGYKKLGSWYFYCPKCVKSFTKDAREVPLETPTSRPTLRDLLSQVKL